MPVEFEGYEMKVVFGQGDIGILVGPSADNQAYVVSFSQLDKNFKDGEKPAMEDFPIGDDVVFYIPKNSKSATEKIIKAFKYVLEAQEVGTLELTM